MTPEVIKTLIEIANEQQRVMAAQAAITRCPRKAILHTNPDLTLPASALPQINRLPTTWSAISFYVLELAFLKENTRHLNCQAIPSAN